VTISTCFSWLLSFRRTRLILEHSSECAPYSLAFFRVLTGPILWCLPHNPNHYYQSRPRPCCRTTRGARFPPSPFLGGESSLVPCLFLHPDQSHPMLATMRIPFSSPHRSRPRHRALAPASPAIVHPLAIVQFAQYPSSCYIVIKSLIVINSISCSQLC